MKKKLSNLILVLVFLVGLSLLLYPTFADYWNSFTQTRMIASYTEQMAAIDEDAYVEYWNSARAYNESLTWRPNPYLLSEEQAGQYQELLNIGGSGVMGYVDIPSINVMLPIYHGTDDAVLKVAVGHLEWSSLPVGGVNSHCVVSGHRGLPSARLFTDLDMLKEGDYFMLNVLDEVLTYEVDQIRIVEPDVTDDLLIEEGKDLCTLVTCTPYGVNSHRMLVRGHRVDNLEEAVAVRVTADAVVVDRLLVAPFVLMPILLLMLVLLLISTRNKRK